MKNLISIIMPIWNVEPYLHRSVDSILSQTYPHLEIILVDDGSPDNCGRICDEYAEKNERIKVIHQSNQGISAARQAGLDMATGDYVFFFDPDDYADADMIASMVEAAEKSGADIVYCNFYRNGEEDKCNYGTDSEELIYRLVHHQAMVYIWQILYRRSVIKNHQISFYPSWLCYCEDLLFMIRCMNSGGTLLHIDKAFYHYMQRDHSASFRSLKNMLSEKEYIKQLQLILDSSKYDNFYYLKRYTYIYAYESRYWKEMKRLFPEIRERLVSENEKNNRYSTSSQLARCMKYPPCLVWFEAKIHLFTTSFLHKLMCAIKNNVHLL